MADYEGMMSDVEYIDLQPLVRQPPLTPDEPAGTSEAAAV